MTMPQPLKIEWTLSFRDGRKNWTFRTPEPRDVLDLFIVPGCFKLVTGQGEMFIFPLHIIAWIRAEEIDEDGNDAAPTPN